MTVSAGIIHADSDLDKVEDSMRSRTPRVYEQIIFSNANVCSEIFFLPFLKIIVSHYYSILATHPSFAQVQC
jgi:hypothetical protein